MEVPERFSVVGTRCEDLRYYGARATTKGLRGKDDTVDHYPWLTICNVDTTVAHFVRFSLRLRCR
jgi:hypothetical protein